MTLLLPLPRGRRLTSCWPAPMQPKLRPRRQPRRASPPSGRRRAFWRTCEVRLLPATKCPFRCYVSITYLSACLHADFDKRVNDNKTAAEDAMKKIPAINATIAAANDKTQQAEAALGNAAADAREAKRKAEEAEKIASNVQKVHQLRHTVSWLRSSPPGLKKGGLFVLLLLLTVHMHLFIHPSISCTYCNVDL